MEGKKLNFNQPFLSVRRNPPTVTSQRSDETKTNNNSHSVIPQLPSHRSELKSGPIRNPGAVPFLWEQTPGQPKQEMKPKHRNTDRPPIAPKLPPGRNPNPNQHGCNNSVSPTTNDNNRQDVIVETSRVESLEREEENESCTYSDDSDGAYVDALDTLSRTESFFLNCSMTGLSGLDDLDIKPSERFSTDPKAREFMMDRFLPAAKAMTSETPQYATKTQNNASQEQQQQQLKNIVNQYKPSLRYGPSFAKRYSHYNGSEEEEEEEEEVSDDDYDHQHANSLGVCGLIPRFCLKGSFGVLNHVPPISVRTRVPLSSCNKVQPRSSSSAGSYSETEIKSRSNRTEIKSIDKIREAALSEDKTKLRDDSGQLETFVSEEKRQAGIEGFGLHGKCGVTTFEELLADQDSPNESNSGCPVIEKTLYVDTIQSVESPNLTTFSLSTQDSEDVPRSRKQDHEVVTKRTDQMDAIDSSLEDFNKLNTLDVQEKFGDINILSSRDKTTECRVFSSTIAKKMQLVPEKEAITVENSYRNYYQLPIPPPLPKSPSDSWLWRTLPSMSAKKSSLSSYISAATKPQNEVSEDRTASNMKWETIVKTTKMPRHDLHYSRESLTAIPET